MSQSEMARRLGIHQSTVSRELMLNRFPDGHYQAQHANKLSQLRYKAGRRKTKKLVKDKRLRRAVINRLKNKDSPEQITGKRKRAGKTTVCPETIYQYLYTERKDLISLLRQKKGKYRRRKGTKAREKAREWAKKTWITERPEYVNNRSSIGHWEGDTVRAKEKTVAIATHVERVSGYGLAIKLEYATALNMHNATVKAFKKIPKAKRLSETNDNGSEFAHFELTERELEMKQYSALPYHSWERGTNENWNGLLRQFFPKGSSFATVTQRDVDKAVRNLNHRPRKRLNYLSPYEVFVLGLKP
ncbi:MAG: IS30 family transposase [bacterium]|nr:IS30 family transposase [bacterium]